MDVFKRELPAGVRKKFELHRGIRVKVLNTLYLKDSQKPKKSKARKISKNVK